MRFVEVKDGLPERKCGKKNLKRYFEGFVSSNVKIAKVEFDKEEYKNISSCQATFIKTIKRFGFPVKVRMINKEIYLVRTDI